MSSLVEDQGEALSDESLDQFVEDVQICLNRREIIEQYLMNAYIRRPREKNIQSELDEFFKEETELVRLYLISKSPSLSLSASLNRAIEENLISEDVIRDFDDFWIKVSWASEAGRAFQLKHDLDVSYWTDKSIGFRVSGNEIIVDHTMHWGVSEVHDLTIPLDVFVDDIGDRLGQVINWLEGQSEEDGEISEELFNELEEDTEQIANLSDHLTAVVNDFNAPE